MIHLELPHINVLSKIDLMEAYGKLAFNLDFYTEVQDLNYLLDHLNNAGDDDVEESSSGGNGGGGKRRSDKFKSLNSAIVSLVQDFNLVSFYPLCIDDAQLLATLVRAVDRANGYIFGQGSAEDLFGISSGMDDGEALIRNVQEKYLRKYLDEEHLTQDQEEGSRSSLIKELKL
jgi:hypothetical protein